MDEERVFSLSYEQLTRFAERRIREWGLRANGTKTYAKEITNCYN